MSLPQSTGADPAPASEATLAGAEDSIARALDDQRLPRGATLDRYVLLARVGAGAMGVVYSAYDPDLDRKVAIKLLRADRRGDQRDDRARKRLLREAQALAKLTHPNVTAVHDIGTHEGEVFLAMEYVEGETLDVWIARAQPDWRTILAKLLDAGAGLRAAHLAGFVHRDFKPSNVMVTAGGEVRITDFGLARALGEVAPRSGDDELEQSRHDALALDLTRTGALLGTPGYMSPEQIAGAPADARSDQFSFCVTTWEALFGRRPFRGTTLGEIGFSVTTGRIEEPPAGLRVPARIRRALVKGLASDPDHRHRDMDEVLAALQPARVRGRGRLVAVTASLAVVAGVAVAWSLRTDERCTGADAWIGEVWNAERSSGVEAAIRATGTSLADMFVDKATAHLDAYAGALASGHTAACRASVISQEESTALYERRLGCLEERRAALDELVRLLSTAERDRLPRLVGASATLPAIARCSGAELLEVGPMPPDASIVDELARARAALAAARVQLDAAEFEEARSRVDTVLAEADEMGYAPLRADALLLAAGISMRTGEYPRAEAELEESFALALRHDDDRVAALSAAQLVQVVGVKGRELELGRRWGRHALALAQRHREGGLEEATVRAQLSALAQSNDDLPAAEREIEAALAIREALLEPDHPDLASALATLAIVQASQRRFTEARENFERALAVRESAYGSHNPDVAGTYVNLGTVLLELKQPDDARQMLDRALAIDEELLGPDHPDMVPLFATRARIQQVSGQLEAARADLERAVAITERVHGPRHPRLITPLVNLAQLLRRMGRDDEARAAAARAETIAGEGGNSSELAHTFHALAAFAADDRRWDRAAQLYGRAVDAFDEAYGPAHADTAAPLLGQGEMRLLLDDADGAVASLERAAALARGGPFEASARFALARALWESGGDRVRAHDLAVQAIESLAGEERASAEAWTSAHRP